MNRAVVVGIGSALALLGGTARAVPDGVGVELNEVVLDGDHGTVHGRIDVPGSGPGGFSLRVRKAEVRDGELYLTGPLDVTFGRVTQTVSTAAMRLSDADGVCDVMAVTVPEMHLDHFGVDVDSAAVDIAVSASTSNGRALANLLCGATHLLDDPSPLATASVPALSELINRSLSRSHPHHGGKGVAAATAPAQAQPQADAQPVEVDRAGERSWAAPDGRWNETASPPPVALDESEHLTPPPPARGARHGSTRVRQAAPSPSHAAAPQNPPQVAQPAQNGQYTASPYYPSPQGAPASSPASATQSAYPQPAPYQSVRPAQRHVRPARSIDEDEGESPSENQ